LTSYERLEGGGIKFNFVIENTQNKPADFCFYHDSRGGRDCYGYILDNRTNKYFLDDSSQMAPSDDVTLIPNMPVEGYMSFPHSELAEAKVIVFYFGFRGRDITAGRWNYSGTIDVGPIKLR